MDIDRTKPEECGFNRLELAICCRHSNKSSVPRVFQLTQDVSSFFFSLLPIAKILHGKSKVGETSKRERNNVYSPSCYWYICVIKLKKTAMTQFQSDMSSCVQ